MIAINYSGNSQIETFGAVTVSPRVLILGDHFGYADGVVHGVTTYYLSVLPRVRARGVELQCCFLREEHPVAEQLRNSGVPARFLGAGKWDPFLFGRVERIVRESDAGVIHALGMKAALLARWAARRTGAAVIIHSHDMNLPPLPLRLLYRFVSLKSERGLAVSTAAADFMPHAYGIDRQRVTVLPNGVDVGGIRQARTAPRPEGVPNGGRLIGWIGRLHAVKGPQRMIRMMAALALRVPDVHLLLVGDGPERAACAQLVRDLGLEKHVSQLGQRSDIGALLGQMRVLCITSENEGFSLVAAEAASAGVPVVGFKVGGLGEVVAHGRTGYLPPDGDDTQFVGDVQRLLEDEGLRSRISQQAEVHAEVFSLERHVDALIAEYQRAQYSTRGGA